jgi:hypothetical protein
MTKEAGRDPAKLELIVRANLEFSNSSLEKDRADFTGSLEQIASDIAAVSKLGAAEIVIDVQFSPDVQTGAAVLARMEQLFMIARAA